jgi:hypothetical protein
MEGPAQRALEVPQAPRPPRRPRMSVDSTLIAGIGTLLLAMGIGVLIGRSGNDGSAKSARVQVVTVAGGAGAASSGASQSAAATSPASSGGTTPTTPAGTHAKARATSKKSAVAPPKVVTVGSPGHGPGYQHGHFTGNFFGE